MGKHGLARSIKCPWRKAIALVVATITAGAWIPFVAGGDHEVSADDDDEEIQVPEKIFETHAPIKPPTVAEKLVPKPKVSLEKPTKVVTIKPVAKATVPKPTHTVSPPPVADQTNSILLSFLRAQLGDRYVLGGNGPDIWDCSGLTVAAYAKLGIHLPRTSQLQSLVGYRVSLSSLKVGDLLFWGVPGVAYHVAVYIGGGQYIAAQNPSVGVVQRSLSYSPPDFARRIL